MSYDNKENRIFWDEMAVSRNWQKLGSPWRPSLKDVENYEIGIRCLFVKPKKILVLGATPELRDLAAQLGKEIWLIDYSQNMLSEMTNLLKSADVKKEKWIIDSWSLSRELKKGSFDVILGDLVLRLIPYGQEEIFLKRIVDFLNPKGFFIVRIHLVNNFLQGFSAKKIINSTLALKKSFVSDKEGYIETLLMARFLDKNFSFRKQERIRKQSWIDINNYLQKNPKISFSRKRILREILSRFVKEKEIPYFFPREKKEIEKKLNIFFEIKNRLIAEDYQDSQYYPVFILKSRI